MKNALERMKLLCCEERQAEIAAPLRTATTPDLWPGGGKTGSSIDSVVAAAAEVRNYSVGFDISIQCFSNVGFSCYLITNSRGNSSPVIPVTVGEDKEHTFSPLKTEL